MSEMTPSPSPNHNPSPSLNTNINTNTEAITQAIQPASTLELAEVLQEAGANSRHYRLQGGGSKLQIGRINSGTPAQPLSLAKFEGIIDYQPSELVLTAGAATKLADIESLLRASGQMLAFEPPNWGRMMTRLGLSPSQHYGVGNNTDQNYGEPTIGGAMMCGWSGPRRLSAGAARDHCLGFEGISGRGEIFHSGAAVVKNVTGYDLPKLIVGSYGTLAAITRLIVKTLPLPEATASLILPLDNLPMVQNCFQALLGGPTPIAAASLLPTALVGSAFSSGSLTAQWQIVLRIEGQQASIYPRLDKLRGLAKDYVSPGLTGHSLAIHSEIENRTLWQGIRDLYVLEGLEHQRELWRFSLPPSQLSSIGQEFRDYGINDWFADWGGAQIFAVPPLVIRGQYANEKFTDWGELFFPLIAKLGGHATRLRADPITRQKKQIFQPLTPELARLNQRVKRAFDPQACLNRGLLYPEN